MQAVIYILIGVAIGLAIGIGASIFIMSKRRPKQVGALQIDRSQRSRGPFIFLELDEDVDWYAHKTVNLRVLNQDLASRE